MIHIVLFLFLLVCLPRLEIDKATVGPCSFYSVYACISAFLLLRNNFVKNIHFLTKFLSTFYALMMMCTSKRESVQKRDVPS